jgi:glycerophosphoryl diester phosphodiesterase
VTRFFSALLLLSIVFLLSLPAVGQSIESIHRGDFSILLGGHRSGRLEFPENTVTAIEAFSQAWPEALVEVDVQMTADGRLILLHDLDVDGVTNGSGVAMLMPFAEIRALDAGWRFTRDSATYPYRGQGVVIPTLQEALKAAPNHPFLIEMKHGEGVARATAAAIKEVGAEARCYVATVNPAYLEEFKEAALEVATCYDVIDASEAIVAIREGRWERYTPPHRMLVLSSEVREKLSITWEELRHFQKRGILLCFFTVNRREEMEYLIDHGVDCILTDYPSRLAALLNKK